jgi:hypothetical protein
MQRRYWPEFALWLGAFVAIYCVISLFTDTQRLHLKGNDCYQYLSMARHMREGGGIATDLLHYEQNQQIGLIPAPQTVFPPGYAILIAALEMLGVDATTAGVGVSLAAFAGLLMLLICQGRLLNIPRGVMWCILFLLLCNGSAWSLGLRVYTEGLFTAVGLLGLVLLMWADFQHTGSWSRIGILASGALFVGLSYWIRYAGCFLVATVVLWYGLRWLRARNQACLGEFAIVSLVLAVLILPLWIRNWTLVGSIQGGNPLSVDNSLINLGRQFVSCWTQLATGPMSETAPASMASRINRLLLALGFGGVLLLIGWKCLNNRGSIFRGDRREPLGLMAIYVAVYVLGMTYVAKYTLINYDDPRMFFPLLPVVLMVLAGLFPTSIDQETPARAGVRRPITIAVAALLAVSYCVGQGYGLAMQGVGEHVKMQEWLSDKIATGPGGSASSMTVAQWAGAHMPAGVILLATDDQACGFMLNRPCLAARFSSKDPRTHEAQMQAMVKRYGVSFVMLFPDGVGTRELSDASPFFAGLVAQQSPEWLQLEVSTAHCRIYRVTEWEKQADLANSPE